MPSDKGMLVNWKYEDRKKGSVVGDLNIVLFVEDLKDLVFCSSYKIIQYFSIFVEYLLIGAKVVRRNIETMSDVVQ